MNAHATSTPLGDSAETRVIKIAFGEEHAKTKLAVSSTKGATGHCFGAAGAVEAVFTTLAVVDRVAPPTINYDDPDPGLRPRLRPERRARPAGSDDVAVSNSFGFGGHNASIVVRALRVRETVRWSRTGRACAQALPSAATHSLRPCAWSRSAGVWSSCTYAGRTACAGTGSSCATGCRRSSSCVRARRMPRSTTRSRFICPWLERQLAQRAASRVSGSSGCG